MKFIYLFKVTGNVDLLYLFAENSGRAITVQHASGNVSTGKIYLLAGTGTKVLSTTTPMLVIRKGNDLFVNKDISLIEALNGFNMIIKHFDREIDYTQMVIRFSSSHTYISHSSFEKIKSIKAQLILLGIIDSTIETAVRNGKKVYTIFWSNKQRPNKINLN